MSNPSQLPATPESHGFSLGPSPTSTPQPIIGSGITAPMVTAPKSTSAPAHHSLNTVQYQHIEKHHAKELMRHLYSLYQSGEYCDLTINVSSSAESPSGLLDAIDVEMSASPPSQGAGSQNSVSSSSSSQSQGQTQSSAMFSPDQPEVKTSPTSTPSLSKFASVLRGAVSRSTGAVPGPSSAIIRCHRIVLISTSGYFASMYHSGMRESQENSIVLRDLPPDSVSALVEFAYTGRITINEENVQRLLFAASVLQVESVARACDAYCKQHLLQPMNCISLRLFAEQHGRQDLVRHADNFIADNFQEAAVHEEFLSAVSDTNLVALLRNELLNVESEIFVYEAVLRWVKFELEKRKNALPSLMQHVRFGQLPLNFLLEVVCMEPLLRENLECLLLVDDAKTEKLRSVGTGFYAGYQSGCPGSIYAGVGPLGSSIGAMGDNATATYSASRTSPRLVAPPERTLPRKSYGGVVFCVGGRGSTGEPYRTVECYDPRTNKWVHVAEMSSKRRHVGVIACGGKLYAIGGHDGHEHLNSGECYDPRLNRWSRISSMSTKRRGLALAALGPVIYAIGGLDDATCMQHVERYDLASDQWSFVSQMHVSRGGVAAVAYKNVVYAVGGNDGTNSVDSCERYDPVLDKWTMCAQMHYKRAGAGIAELNGYLYVAGGFDNDLPLATVEQYDPHQNVWTTINNMSVCRGGAGLAALAGKLYVVGGHDGQEYLLSVECYDPGKNAWENVAPISVSRAGAGVAFCDVPARVVLDNVMPGHASMNFSSNLTSASLMFGTDLDRDKPLPVLSQGMRLPGAGHSGTGQHFHQTSYFQNACGSNASVTARTSNTALVNPQARAPVHPSSCANPAVTMTSGPAGGPGPHAISTVGMSIANAVPPATVTSHAGHRSHSSNSSNSREPNRDRESTGAPPPGHTHSAHQGGVQHQVSLGAPPNTTANSTTIQSASAPTSSNHMQQD